MKKPTETALLWLIAACAGCGTTCTRTGEEIECISDSNCDLEVGGECLTACSGSKWCVYPEVTAACPSGKRWSDLDTGDGLAGECLEDSDLCLGDVDAGPDGGGNTCEERILFTGSGTNGTTLFSMRTDGTDLTDLAGQGGGLNPRWSPSGERIAFASNARGIFDVYTMNSDGSNIQRLTNSNSDDNQPHWSPDESFIVFNSSRDDGAGDLYRISPEGSNLTRITNAQGRAELGGFVSRNATRITYVADGEIRTVNPDGSADRMAASGTNIGGWSPTSDVIVYVAGSSPRDIFTVNDAGGNPDNLTDDNNNEAAPTWSPDGTMIAFSATIGGDDEIFVMNADGSNITNITNNIGLDKGPSWSPDGAQLAFLSERGGLPGIWSVNFDGTNPMQLPPLSVALGVSVQWSPCQVQQ